MGEGQVGPVRLTWLVLLLAGLWLAGCVASPQPVASFAPMDTPGSTPAPRTDAPALRPLSSDTPTLATVPTVVDIPTDIPTDTPIETPAPTDSSVPPTPTPALTPAPTSTGPLVYITRPMNLRGGPGTDYPVVGSADGGQSFPITGTNEQGDWWQIAVGDGVAWVYAPLASAEGSDGVPVVAAPPLPTQPPLPT